MTTIKKIQSEILAGNVVIVPTETVYGLLVLEKFKSKLNQLKQRPENISFANVFASVDIALEHLDSTPETEILLRSLLPGPFTVIIDSKKGDKLGIRIPDHPILLEIIHNIEQDIVMTSVNVHKQPPAVSYEEAVAAFPFLCGIDGGKPKYSSPSMILEVKSRRK